MVRTRSGNSLVERVRRLAGRDPAEPRPETLDGPDGPLVPIAPAQVLPAADGYMRRSPVQPMYRRTDYYRRLILRAVGTVLLLALAGAVIALLLTRLKLI